MARELTWKRVINTSFNWAVGLSGNQPLTDVNPGETMTRCVIDLRMWAHAVGQTGINEQSLYVPYLFMVFWGDDRVIPNPNLVTLQQVAQTYPDNVLWMERYTMRDAYTPPKFATVNMGWIDDRPSMQLDITKQRINDKATGIITLRFAWQAFASVEANPLKYVPRVSHSTLIRTANL